MRGSQSVLIVIIAFIIGVSLLMADHSLCPRPCLAEEGFSICVYAPDSALLREISSRLEEFSIYTYSHHCFYHRSVALNGRPFLLSSALPCRRGTIPFVLSLALPRRGSQSVLIVIIAFIIGVSLLMADHSLCPRPCLAEEGFSICVYAPDSALLREISSRLEEFSIYTYSHHCFYHRSVALNGRPFLLSSALPCRRGVLDLCL
nr:hypothetical protein CFP56_76398 [Quercus suber]